MGFFLAFEGPEGSGKSTQAKLLAETLVAAGHNVVRTREPGGTPISERVRTVLLDHASYAMLPQTEALLYAAARAQLVGQVIRPALEEGAIVICDRYVDSSLAYQVGGRGLPFEDVLGIQRLATGGLWPDLRVLLDLPVDVGLSRRFEAGDPVNRLDIASREFHERVRACYLELAAREPGRWLVLNAEEPVEALASRIAAEVETRLLARTDGLATTTIGGGE
jgi:dTMP kinase